MNVIDKEIQYKQNEAKLDKLIADEKVKLNASEADKKVMDFPIYDKPEEVETGLISSEEKVAVDNFTGRLNVISDKPSEDEIDFDNLELSEEEQAEIDRMVKEADLSGMSLTPARMQKEILESFDFLNKKEREDFGKVIDRVRNKEQFSVYAALPESMKIFINLQCGGSSSNKNTRNAYARGFVENFVAQLQASCSLDAMADLFDKKKDEELKKLGQELSSGYLALQKQRWDLYALEAEKILEKSKTEEVSEEDLNKASSYQSFSKSFNDSYTLLPLIEDVKNRRGKYKFKPIQVEKFTKECESFNIKYERSAYDIKEISGCLPVIQRLIDTDVATAKFILLAFMRFTMNYKPDVVTEHIFMSNFVSNIYLSDTATTEDDMVIVDELKNGLNTLAGLL